MSTVNLEQALEVAVRASKLAAMHAVEKHANREKLLIDEKNPRDFVTAADKECQVIIIEEIQKTYPDHRFIGEEEGSDNLGNPDSPYAWIIDPIDGTKPFINGRDNFGNIISLKEEDTTVVGLMNIPLMDELYTGYRGGGSYFNGETVKLRGTKNLNESILSSNTIRRAVEVDGVPTITSPWCASLENYGSAVQEFGEMLKGFNDGCFFKGIRLWDVDAGCMLVEEAGGKSWYDFLEPGNLRGGLRVASSTEAIFDELKDWVTTNF